MRITFRGTQAPCRVAVIPSHDHVLIAPERNIDCTAVTRSPPRCTLVQIWARAKAANNFVDLPPGTTARMTWNWSGDGMWGFSFVQTHTLSQEYDVGIIALDDNCN